MEARSQVVVIRKERGVEGPKLEKGRFYCTGYPVMRFRKSD